MRGRFLVVALAALMLDPLATSQAGARLHPADVTTTVGFETYSPGTVITNQYSGITFEGPGSAGFAYGAPADGVARCGTPPVVVAGYAHSGANAGELNHLDEFSVFGTFASFTNLAGSVSVYVGTTNGVSSLVELDAYDADRHLLPGSVSATTSGTGANTLLSYSTGGKGDIAYVAICSTSVGDVDGVIDDLSFSVPPSVTPIVGVSTTTTAYEIGQGGTRDIPLSVVRLDGATGPVTIDVGGLPSGVTSSLSENPVAAADTTTTLSLRVPATVPVGNYQVSLSASAAGATSQAPTVITLSVAPALLITPPSTTYQIGPCSGVGVPLVADVGPELPGPLSFTLDTTSLPAGLSASFNPAQAAVTGGSAATHLELSSTGGTGTTSLQVTASLRSGASQTFDVSVQQVGPEVASVGPLGGTVAYTPRAQKPGTAVEIYGHDFCGTATVAFGNGQATVEAAVKHNAIYGDYIRVAAPRDATSGPVTVTTGSPPVSGTSSQSLTVDSYRNTEAFNFHNFYPQLGLQDLTDAFGSQQTYINVNPCGFFTFGAANCSVSTGIPDPVALAWLGIANAAADGGTCFGISLTDQRLLSAQIDLKSFPRVADSVYGLDGPAVGSDGWARGSEPLLEVLKAQHLMQFSTEFLSKWVLQAAAQSVEPGSQAKDAVAYEIDQIFKAGRYPLIELNDTNGGGGHVVVAYDITPDSDGGYDIYVYDSNNPYTSNEGTDGKAHAAALEASVIDLESDGTWQLPSTTEPPSSGGGPFQGGPSAIVVTDPASIPLRPTLATLGGIAPGLLFSSAGPPGDATGGMAGAGRVTQVSGPGGRALYDADGALSTNRATRLEAAPFAPLVGKKRGISNRPQLVVVAPQVRQLTVSTTGVRGGASTETFVDGGFLGAVGASTAAGAHQQAVFSATSGTAGFRGATSAPLSLQVDQVTATGSRIVQVTSVGATGGAAMLTLNRASGAVTLTHRGGAVTFALTLSGDPRGGLPASFTSGPVNVGPGQAMTLSGINWGHLASAQLSVRVGKRDLRLDNRLKTAQLAAIGQLQVLPGTHHRLRLVVNGKLSGLAPGSTAFAVWLVHKAKRVIAQHSTSLQPKNKGFTASWAVRLVKAPGLTFSAEVVAVSMKGAVAHSSVATRSINI
jgi:hypothetical protein